MDEPRAMQPRAVRKPSHARPSITVVVHVYNMGRFITETINSLRSQSFQDFDVLCINDGSRDGSAQILHRVAEVDDRFRVIDARGLGEGAGLNLGIEKARGSYVCLLKSDDLLDRDALVKLARVAESTMADVIKANQWLYWSEPKERKMLSPTIGPSIADHLFSGLAEPEVLFACSTPWAGMYKRSFLLSNGIDMIDSFGALSRHLDFGFKALASSNRVFCVQDPVLYSRQDNLGGLVDRREEAERICEEFDAIEDFVEADPARYVLRPYVYRLRFDAYTLNLMRLDDEAIGYFLEIMVGDMARGMQVGDYAPVLFTEQQNNALRLLLSDPRGFAIQLLNPEPQPKKRRSLFGRRDEG